MVFHAPGSEKVKEKVAAIGGVLMRARAGLDFPPKTAKDIAIYKSIFQFKRAGFPTNVVYPADPALRPILLPEFLTQAMVLHALELAGTKL